MAKKNNKILWAAAFGAAIFIVAGAAAAGGWYAGTQELPKNSSNKKTASGEKKTADDTKETDDTKSSSGSDKVTLNLYYSDSNAEYLIPEQREISVENEADVYQAAVKALIKGPADAGHFATVPANMVVAGVTVNNNTAQVDLSASMNDLVPQGTTGERMFIYSIVNTLTEFPEVTQVRFLAGGVTPVTPGSRIDWTYAFTRNEALIRK